MEKTTLEKKYFYGNEISSYGLQNGYVDYRTLAKCFDAVLANDLMAKTFDIGYWERESGFPADHSERIEELEEDIEELENRISELEDEVDTAEESELSRIEEDIDTFKEKIEELEELVEELKQDEEYYPDVFQWYIVDYSGAELLKRETNEIVYYNEELDLYLWGVTHYGTAWDYVLTDIKIDW